MRPVRTITSAALPLLLAAGLTGLVAVAPARAADPTADDDPAAVAALRRAASSALTASFEGTQVTTAWTTRGATTHVLDVVQRDGQRWASLRDGSASGAPSLARPGLGSPAADQVLALLVSGFRLAMAGQDEVAGRRTGVVVASRAGRESARWWLDDETGLVLRQEIFDRSGRLRRMAAFLDLRSATLPALPAAVVTPAAARVAWPAVAGPATGPGSVALADGVRRVRGAGYEVPGSLPGGLQLVDVRQPAPGDGSAAVHLTYTDGLCGVSMFLQRGRLDAERLKDYRAEQWGGTPVRVAEDWPMRVVWQRGQTVLTLVADADAEEVRSVVGALPGDRHDAGLLAIVLASVDGAVSWFRR